MSSEPSGPRPLAESVGSAARQDAPDSTPPSPDQTPIPNRLWLRWTALFVFVVLLVIAFIQLGQWQLRRLDERRANNATVEAHASAPPRPYQDVFDHPISDSDQWQRVTATGTFDGQHQFQVRYRTNNDEPGFEVVAPLHTDSGETVLVNRGYIVVPQGTKIPDALPAPPAGQVTVTGHVRRSEVGKPKAINPVNGTVRLVNAPAIGASLPYPVLDGYIGALQLDPPTTSEFKAIPLPDSSEGPHLSYALQWFLFTSIAVTGLVVFIRGDLKERRKDAERAVAGAQPGPEPQTGATQSEPTQTGATQTPVAQTPGAQTPVAQTPGAQTPVAPGQQTKDQVVRDKTAKKKKKQKVKLDPLGRPIDPTGPVRSDRGSDSRGSDT